VGGLLFLSGCPVFFGFLFWLGWAGCPRPVSRPVSRPASRVPRLSVGFSSPVPPFAVHLSVKRSAFIPARTTQKANKTRGKVKKFRAVTT